MSRFVRTTHAAAVVVLSGHRGSNVSSDDSLLLKPSSRRPKLTDRYPGIMAMIKHMVADPLAPQPVEQLPQQEPAAASAVDATLGEDDDGASVASIGVPTGRVVFSEADAIITGAGNAGASGVGAGAGSAAKPAAVSLMSPPASAAKGAPPKSRSEKPKEPLVEPPLPRVGLITCTQFVPEHNQIRNWICEDPALAHQPLLVVTHNKGENGQGRGCTIRATAAVPFDLLRQHFSTPGSKAEADARQPQVFSWGIVEDRIINMEGSVTPPAGHLTRFTSAHGDGAVNVCDFSDRLDISDIMDMVSDVIRSYQYGALQQLFFC